MPHRNNFTFDEEQKIVPLCLEDRICVNCYKEFEPIGKEVCCCDECFLEYTEECEWRHYIKMPIDKVEHVDIFSDKQGWGNFPFNNKGYLKKKQDSIGAYIITRYEFVPKKEWYFDLKMWLIWIWEEYFR